MRLHRTLFLPESAPCKEKPGRAAGGAHNGRGTFEPVNEMDRPIHMTLGIRFCLQLREYPVPYPGISPSAETAVYRRPWPVPLGDISPGRSGSHFPENPVDDLAVVFRRPSCFRFLGRKIVFELLPLLPCEFMPSAHSYFDATPQS